MMKEITTSTELIAAAVRQGVEIGHTEADIVLGYMEGHDFALMMDEEFNMALHDCQDGEKHDSDEPYTVRDAVEFCQEMNEELLTDESSKDTPDGEYLMDLRKDEVILDCMMARVSEVIKPTIKEYKVAIIESLRMVVAVEAASWSEAKMKVEQQWRDGDYILDADHFAGVMFTSCS